MSDFMCHIEVSGSIRLNIVHCDIKKHVYGKDIIKERVRERESDFCNIKSFLAREKSFVP